MKYEFVKLHGLGNDFVFIDDLSNEIELSTDDVMRICDRHKGIGADGVILVRPSEDDGATAYMHYINSDGTLAQMCGNGVRCFAKYLVDRGFTSDEQHSLDVDTMSGIKHIEFTSDDDGRLVDATVNMGKPCLVPNEIPVSIDANAETEDGIPYVKEHAISSPWGDFEFTCVSMGNPHAVCFLDDISDLDDALFSDPQNKCLETFDIDLVGRYFESHPLFPEKANIEFVEIDDGGINMRVYERGCGETMACGTGTCATNVAAYLTGRAPKTNTVHLVGGDLDIEWLDNGDVLMTGPAEESFNGILVI